LLRKVHGVSYQRERIETPDGDFLDIDWSLVGASRVAVLLHGLEGDSKRAYMLGMAKALNRNGWDALAMNFRSCSGEVNRKVSFYHSGYTEDLATVLSVVDARGQHSEAALIGFSLGGNLVLKYLGEQSGQAAGFLKKAAAFSVPCDLKSGAEQLGSPANRLYMRRFLRMLRQKIRDKMAAMPGVLSDDGYERIRNFREYDDRYTSVLHGFRDAEDYWQKASSKPFLPDIRIPTLLVNAADDPFLAGSCYPIEEARSNPAFFLEIPKHGGHVGFMAFNRAGEYWSESRAVAFLNA
jgi:hypothetical protein